MLAFSLKGTQVNFDAKAFHVLFSLVWRDELERLDLSRDQFEKLKLCLQFC